MAGSGKSRPTRACELKSGADETAGGYKASRPTRACELKFGENTDWHDGQYVTPHAGV